MLDPVTSLGLATNVIQLIDFGFTIFQEGRQIARHGATVEQKHLRQISEGITETCKLLPLDLVEPFLASHHDPAAGSPNQADGSPRASTAGLENGKAPLPDDEQQVTKLAIRARATAETLTGLLGSLTLDEHSRKRKRSAVVCAVKGMWKAGDVRDARTQLNELHWQLMLNLQVMQGQKTSEILAATERLTNRYGAERDDRFHALKREFPNLLRSLQHYTSVADLEQSADSSTVAPKSLEKSGGQSLPAGLPAPTPEEMYKTLAGRLRGIRSQEKTAAFCRGLIRELSFDELLMRHDIIAKAHRDTFSWIYDREDLKFNHWAQDDSKEQVYWITGKPGSGKSTLMKFLAAEDRTIRLLSSWAGSHECIVASFFFWHAGTEMQKSQIGLLRSLLIQLIRQCPESAKEILDDKIIMSWTGDALIETIRAILQHRQGSTKFCFFIDGLDEYSGEFADIIKLLDNLVSSNNVKLCVSSRPHNAFQRRYGEDTKMQLAVQQLTHQDIYRFASDRLRSSAFFDKLRQQNCKGCDELISEIARKAEGVFLWVSLAVRSLLRGLDNDDDLTLLRQRLNEFPETLDGFFRRMFHDIESVYKIQAARIMLAACHYNGPLTLYTPIFIADEVYNPDYAARMSIKFSEIQDSSDDVKDVKRRLHARCGDILEVVSAVHGVSFCHRTAYDWLQQTFMQEILKAKAGAAFNLNVSLAKVAMARLKTTSVHRSRGLMGEFLAYEEKIPQTSIPMYLALLESFVAACDTVLQEKCLSHETATMLHESGYGFSTYSEADKLDMSFELTTVAFRATADLTRLRKKYGVQDDGVFLEATQRNDMKILFGLNQ